MKIVVYENFNGIDNLIGYLNAETIRGHLSTSFEYDKEYLRNKKINFCIDSEIQNFAGLQWTKNGNGLFRIFLDQCPDRWGRRLIEKKEKIDAEREKRKVRTLNEIDYLLNVSDMTRIGSFRFKLDENGEFLSNIDGKEVPPITDIRRLYDASMSFEKNDDNDEWLKQLFYQGSSLGGARPKANVIDTNGDLYIAKFPSIKDEYDIEVFEKITFDLANLCGINVANTNIMKISDKGHIFLSKRFDREKEKRAFYMSAMTALAKNDGDKASYLDIVTFIRENTNKPNENLIELYKRLTFNVIMCNTDDHLRNHAFIYKNGSLYLSPAFDLNINIYNNGGLSLNIDEDNNDLSFDLVLSTAKYYGIKSDEAKKIISDMKEIVKKNIEILAGKYGVKNEVFKDVVQYLNIESN